MVRDAGLGPPAAGGYVGGDVAAGDPHALFRVPE